jgi:hypothetical protein
MEMRSVNFLVEPQNQGRRFVSSLASKPLERFSLVWPQNRWRWFLIGLGLKTDDDGLWVVWPQNHLDVFADLASKPVATVSGGLASKCDATVFFSLTSKLVATVFSSLALKLVAMVSPGLASTVSWLSGLA